MEPVNPSGRSQERCPHTGSAFEARQELGPDYGVTREGVVYFRRAHSVDYGPDYFLAEYEQQYGRSYLADESHLRILARERLARLRPICPPPATLFEIGAAAGFFLDEARRAGYRVSGLEVSDYAAKHAREQLGLDVRTGSFPADAPRESFDCVAAFYVLEHLPNQRDAFVEVAARIRAGGAFVFALPSTNGPLFRTDPAAWVKTHPRDHFADYNPRALERVLPLYGMQLADVTPASFHPQRMRGRPWWRWFPALYRVWARRRAFGDTMEGIAVRTGSAPEPR